MVPWFSAHVKKKYIFGKMASLITTYYRLFLNPTEYVNNNEEGLKVVENLKAGVSGAVVLF